jgi:TM2 domain-containing membrane protein YozV
MKIKLLFCFIILIPACFAQTNEIDFYSQGSIKKFADYLYCEKDYLRAANEYNRLIMNNPNDTVQFKIALSYSYIKDYNSALNKFSEIAQTSSYYDESELEQLKIRFMMNDFEGLRSFYYDSFMINSNKYNSDGKKLLNFSYLFTDEGLIARQEFLVSFKDNGYDEVSKFYEWKEDPPYKNSIIAGIMSAIIPGSGKIYAGETSDGIVAFLTTAVFSFIAYDNFRANHNTRAWVWTSVAALFYAGNVYGSIASAQIYNARITFEFNERLKLFLQNKNYFTPEYDFCK